MGYMKNLMIEMQEDDEGNAIAAALGISWMDLYRVHYEVDANKNDAG